MSCSSRAASTRTWPGRGRDHALSYLRRRGRPALPRPRRRRCPTASVRPRAPRRPRAPLPARGRPSAPTARSCRSSRRRRRSAVRRTTTSTSRRSPTSCSRTRATTRWASSPSRASARTASWSSSPATTATCCATSSSAGVPVLGIDPAPGPGAAPREARASRPLREFFGAGARPPARRRGPAQADVIIANNVMAHVPDLNGFVEGIATPARRRRRRHDREPYVRDLIDHCEFDTIYHEHLCYFSCTAVDALMRRHGLYLNDVEYFPTCTAARCAGTSSRERGRPDAALRAPRLAEERSRARQASATTPLRRAGRAAPRPSCSALLAGLKAEGASIAAYGAAAKGTTLVNYVGHRHATSSTSSSTATCTSRAATCPARTSRSAPVERCSRSQPDYVLLLAWNFQDEIMRQQAEYAARGGRFIVPVPEPVRSLVSAVPRHRRSPPARPAAAGHRVFYEQSRRPGPQLPARRHAARRRWRSRTGDLGSASATPAASSRTRRSTPTLQDYSIGYEETQGFSPRSRVRRRARPALGRADTTCAARPCSRSAAARASSSSPDVRGRRRPGIGIDPGVTAERIDSARPPTGSTFDRGLLLRALRAT